MLLELGTLLATAVIDDAAKQCDSDRHAAEVRQQQRNAIELEQIRIAEEDRRHKQQMTRDVINGVFGLLQTLAASSASSDGRQQ